MMLLKRYDPKKHDVTGWLMSEKYDGVRAYWDGSEFRSRSGKIAFKAPNWYISSLPNMVLDGELHGGRGNFSKACGIARRLDADEEWNGLTFTIFDAPNAPGPLRRRLGTASAALMSAGTQGRVEVVKSTVVRSAEHVARTLLLIEESGGEGLVLRHPTAPYEWKRTSNALKVKSEQDAEAIVIGTSPGKRKNEGLIGALVCRLPNGVEFKVNCRGDAARTLDDWIGKTITFSYFEIFEKTGKPRHPTFVRIRA